MLDAFGIPCLAPCQAVGRDVVAILDRVNASRQCLDACGGKPPAEGRGTPYLVRLPGRTAGGDVIPSAWKGPRCSELNPDDRRTSRAGPPRTWRASRAGSQRGTPRPCRSHDAHEEGHEQAHRRCADCLHGNVEHPRTHGIAGEERPASVEDVAVDGARCERECRRDHVRRRDDEQQAVDDEADRRVPDTDDEAGLASVGHTRVGGCGSGSVSQISNLEAFPDRGRLSSRERQWNGQEARRRQDPSARSRILRRELGQTNASADQQ